MKQNMQKKWFSLFPSVFIWRKKNNCFIYDSNTFHCKRINIDSPEIETIITALQEIDNLYCIDIDASFIEDHQVMSFFKALADLKMGTIINEDETLRIRPVQFPPLLNIQSAVERLSNKELTDMTVGENILDYLHEIHIVLSEKIESNTITAIMNFCDSGKISNLYAIKISGYQLALANLTDLWQFLNSMPVLITLVLDFKEDILDSLFSIKKLNLVNVNFVIRVTHIFDKELFCSMENFLSSEKLLHEYEFWVSNERDFEHIQAETKDITIETMSIKPFFDGRNHTFFEQYIYLDEEDIQNTRITKKNIFAHQALNTNDFGKITIMSDGKVYANTHFPPLGTVNDDIRLLLYKEISSGTTWRRVRNMEPCCECIYQWICPSPSDYELEIGKSNLCHATKVTE